MRPLTKEDVADAVLAGLEKEYPTAGAFIQKGTNRVILLHETVTPELFVIDVELAELRPV